MELAAALVYRGDALKLQKRVDDSKQSYAEALKIIEDLGDKEIEDPLVARFYGVALVSRADTLQSEGKLEDAGKLIRKSLEIREHLAQGADHDVSRQRDLTVGLNRLALWHRAMGDLDTAIPLFKRAYDIRERSLGIDRNARTMRDVAVAGSAYGMALLEQQSPDPDTAEPVLKHALDLITGLNCSDSSSSRTIADTVRAYADMGDLHLSRHDFAKAADSFTRGIDHGQPHASEGKDLVLAQELLRAHERLGNARQSRGDKAAAKSEYQQALMFVAQLGTEMEGMKDAQTRLNAAISKLKE